MYRAFINATLCSESALHPKSSLLIHNDKIIRVGTGADIQAELRAQAHHVTDCEDRLLAPGFIDTQVNGGGGVLFNDNPSVETIATIAQAHRAHGTTGLLPTLISDDMDKIAAAIAAVEQAIAENGTGILGIHLEGPFLNTARKGIHDSNKFRPLTDRDIAAIASLRSGRTVVTLAPEMVAPEQIKTLAAHGVLVCAGHSDATYAEVKTALAAGLRGFTHLFNAMSPLQSRAPGVVGAALEDEDSWCGLIVDGYHVAPATLRVAVKAKSYRKMMLVTDAMACAGTGDSSFQLGQQTIYVRDDYCVDEKGTLAGSNLTMDKAVRHAVDMIKLPREQALQMAAQNPAEFLGMGHRYGKIQAGYQADLVLLADDLSVAQTWVGGRLYHPTP